MTDDLLVSLCILVRHLSIMNTDVLLWFVIRSVQTLDPIMLSFTCSAHILCQYATRMDQQQKPLEQIFHAVLHIKITNDKSRLKIHRSHIKFRRQYFPSSNRDISHGSAETRLMWVPWAKRCVRTAAWLNGQTSLTRDNSWVNEWPLLSNVLSAAVKVRVVANCYACACTA